MKSLVPFVETFHRRLSRFSFIANRNWMLRRSLWLVQRIYCLLTCSGDILTASVSVGDSLTLLRAPDLMAKKTIISNLSAPVPVAMGHLASGGFNHTPGAPDPEVGQPVQWEDQQAVIATVGDVFSPQGPEYDYYVDLTFTPPINSLAGGTLNLLSNPAATIFENGKIVALVVAGESKELELSGRYMVEARAATGQTLALEIATYRRCECGDDYIPPYGQPVEPIGGDII